MTQGLTKYESKEIAVMEEATTAIDNVVKRCLPITSQQAEGFGQALVLANGVKQLREIFMSNKDIKDNVMAMANTPLGFMTDRSPAAIAASKKREKPVPYTYNEITECCIEGMMKGYRITGNEFNIIAGRFYPAKDGKFRKIIENESVANFQFAASPPLFCTEERINYGKTEIVAVAKVQCYASWLQDGKMVKLGYSDVAEDKLVFKIKVNAMMGDDGVTGKALSKLFSRVLMRLDGKIIPESTDIEERVIDIKKPQKDINDIMNPVNQDIKNDPRLLEKFKLSENAYGMVLSELGEPKTNDDIDKFCIRFDEITA